MMQETVRHQVYGSKNYGIAPSNALISASMAGGQIHGYALVKIGALTYGVASLKADQAARSDMYNGDYLFTFDVSTTPLAKSLSAVVNWVEDGYETYFADYDNV